MKKLFFLLFTFSLFIFPQNILDNFKDLKSWRINSSEGVKVNIDNNKLDDNSLHLVYDFTKGSGYGGIQKIFDLDISDNFEFSFNLKGNSPINNLEFKLIDSSGDNVWWVIKKSFEFPASFQKIIIKKRDISFAWGPGNGVLPSKIKKIEFMISSATGGNGEIFISDFSFRKLKQVDSKLIPATTFLDCVKINTEELFNKNSNKIYFTNANQEHEYVFDFDQENELGGIIIYWDSINYAKSYKILISDNNKEWQEVYSGQPKYGGISFAPFISNNFRYLKLRLSSSNSNLFGIKRIEFKDYKFSQNLNSMFSEISKYYPKGHYPEYYSNIQQYWTIVGRDLDTSEALINTNGIIETGKQSFSIEPFIKINDDLLTHDNFSKEQKLEDGYLPIPSVIWKNRDIELNIQLFNSDKNNKEYYVSYKLVNRTRKRQKLTFYLAFRPFQVNPPWQNLNFDGGVSKIKSIKFENNFCSVENNKIILSSFKPDKYFTYNFDDGDLVDLLKHNIDLSHDFIENQNGLNSGGFIYNIVLKPRSSKIVNIKFSGNYPSSLDNKEFLNEFKKTKDYWKKELNRANIVLPNKYSKYLDVLKSNLAYILINKDGSGIQPGSRTYERSWIRDGALTSNALLKLGLFDEVKNYLNWYSKYQYESGKIPCVVDKRGPDPVPENDSNGEYIFAILQYYLYTGDIDFLKEKFDNVVKAVDYLNYLRYQRQTDHYKNGNDSIKTQYGLLTESISHEGYSAKPMHSYWDDFFALRGYKDAETIAKILNRSNFISLFKEFKDTFSLNLTNSILNAIKYKNINYVPGCAELGDFDATSTAISLFPIQVSDPLLRLYIKNTFDKYYKFISDRANNNISWDAYTPYEVRTAGSFFILEEPDRAYKLYNFLFKDLRPYAWNQWAEVVWKDSMANRFLGDMPHTWVGSDYINSFRNGLVFEDENDSSLIIGLGITKDYFQKENDIMKVINLPIYGGTISFSIQKNFNKFIINISTNSSYIFKNIIFNNLLFDYPERIIINKVNYYGNCKKISLNKSLLPATIILE